MKTGRHFQLLLYALIIRDAIGAKITGTGSIYDLEGTRALAASVFRVNRRATFVDIHPYIEGGSYTDAPQETVHRSGITVAPLPSLPSRESKQPEGNASEGYGAPVEQAEPSVEAVEPESSTEFPVEQTSVESSSVPPQRSRRGKAKQEAS